MGLRFDNIPASAYDGVIRKLFGHLNLKDKPDHYECICPFCGDIRKPNKRKVWIYKDTWKAICYKGCFDENLLRYLKENSPDDYSDLLLYAIDEDDKPIRGEEQSKQVTRTVPSNLLPFSDGELVSLSDPDDPLARVARELCQSRRIRSEVYETWYACRKGEQFYKHNEDGSIKYYPGTTRPVGNEYNSRVIIPFYKFGGSWGQFDARAIDPANSMRYMNFRGVKREAYNIDFVDFTKRFYILEGTIDSTFIRNSIAIGGIQHLTDTITDNPNILKYADNAVVIWDNDTAGRQAAISDLSRRFKWFDWQGISAKDVNGGVLSGEFPVDSCGFVDDGFISARVRDKDLADIVMTMRYGNIRKDMYKAKLDARRNARLNNGAIQGGKRSISFF